VSGDATAPERAALNEQIGIPATVVLAPIWRRVLAQIIDQLIVLVPVVAIALAVGVRDVDDITDHAFAINVAVIATAFVYEFVLIGAWGRTVGKLALGTRAVRIDTGGAVLWYSSAIRALVPLAAGVIPGIGQILSLVVYLRAFLDPRKQGWHDRAAGTIVVLR
jgi:uncharacterized RDD family membrane protein YckC